MVDQISDDQIRELMEMAKLRRRQNAHTRSLRRDCKAALAGDKCCREHVAAIWARRSEIFK